MKKRIKKIRKFLGLNQRQFAEKIGVSAGTLGGWECGLHSVPKTRVYQICNEFGISQKWLETGFGDMFADKKSDNVADDNTLLNKALELFDALPKNLQDDVIRIASAILSRADTEDDEKE